LRKIIHVDMDCFYAAVEVKHRPELGGKPLGIGGPPNTRSVLCTASYEARKFGVRSAMPSSQAVRLCPQLILIRPNFELYKKESQAVREIFRRYSERIEPLSLDEAYLDVTGSPHFNGSATRIAQEIRANIREELRLTASAGVAPNKFLAKIASDWKKPDGLFVIRPEAVAEFVKPLPVEKIHGVGRVTAKKMHELGLKTCSDIQNTSLWQLTKWFGSRGADLQQRSMGIDEREVESSSERKSLTVEETYNQDLQTLQECTGKIAGLYEDFERRMDRSGLRDRIQGWVVKVKFHDFKTTTHERSSSAWPLARDFADLLARAWERRSEPVRLLGLGARIQTERKTENTGQLSFEL
jgi:DNA polymerase-4